MARCASTSTVIEPSAATVKVRASGFSTSTRVLPGAAVVVAVAPLFFLALVFITTMASLPGASPPPRSKRNMPASGSSAVCAVAKMTFASPRRSASYLRRSPFTFAT